MTGVASIVGMENLGALSRQNFNRRRTANLIDLTVRLKDGIGHFEYHRM